MNADYNLAKRIAVLHEKLREMLATCDRWMPLIEGISIQGIAERGPVSMESWGIDECREVWDWTQDESAEIPKCLLAEVERMRGPE